jgi:trk system potassium uptake protein TrkA
MKMIIVGCGRVGSELAENLEANGHHVTVVDPVPAAFHRLHSTFRGQTVTGIGFDREVLVRAGIEEADALAAVFSNDATNLIVARVARDRFNVPLVVARLHEPSQAEMYRRFGVQTVSIATWGVGRLEQVMTCRQVQYVVSLGNGEVQVIEMRIPAHMAARPVSSLLVPGEIVPIGLARGGHTFIPSPDTRLEEDDLLSLSVVTTALGRLETQLNQGG